MKPTKSTGIAARATRPEMVAKGNGKLLSGKQLALNWPDLSAAMKKEKR